MTIVERILKGDIKGVFIDSREPVEGGLFVPIIGEKFNGNSFIINAFKAGAKASLVDRIYYEENESKLKELDIYIVDDTLEALQFLARELRDSLDLMVVGITGSNGKTTTKNLLKSICEKKYRTHATKGNFNNEIGMPMTLLNMPLDTQVMILEMGMSKAGEIAQLVKIARPSIGVITNIGTSHIEFFKDQSGIFDAKMEIANEFNREDILVVNGKDPFFSQVKDKEYQIKMSSFNDIEKLSQEKGWYQFNYKDQAISLKVPGLHNVSNALLAIKVAECLCIEKETIKEGLESYTGEKMRFEKHEHQGITIFNDAYNASPASMIAAIQTVLTMDGSRKIAVLGDMFELGSNSASLHRNVAEDPSIHELDMLFTIGEDSRYISDDIKNAKHFTNLNKLNQAIVSSLKRGDVLLVKASRGMQLERVVNYVKEHYHE